MSNSPDSGNPREGGAPRKPENAIDRRTFISTSALLGLGFAAGCSGVGRDGAGMLSAPSMLQAVPDGNTRALQIFNESDIARDLGAWLQGYGLEQAPGRALLFDVPAVSELPTGLTADDRPSLVGESAYRAFSNDSFAQSRFTDEQRVSIASMARIDMASDIGSLIHNARPVIAVACCCCACCCSLCCCSCNNYDSSTVHNPDRFLVSAVPYDSPGIDYAGPVRQYFSGTVGVQANGEAVALVTTVTNDPAMTAQEVVIGLLDRETRQVSTYRFTPQELEDLGPEALADRIFGA